MFEKEDIIPLSGDVFRLMRDVIRDYCGIYFDDSSRYLIEKRLSRRVRSHSLDDFRDYYRFILYDSKAEEELSFIVDILTVNETYFFREQNQLKAFTDEILPEIRDKNRQSRKLRVWSAGCSTGEEPYTISILVNELGSFFGWDIEIYGSDINQRVLQTARNGVYRKSSFRSADPKMVSKYFVEQNSDFRIIDTVKRNVNFSYLNLLDPFKAKFFGKMDVIFCRNVLIYFDIPSRKKVIESFHDRLTEGGYLLLGHAESLMNISTAFTLKHLKNDMVYQKPFASDNSSRKEVNG